MMKYRFLPLTVALIAAIILAFVVEDFFHEVIVRPLLYVFWIVTLFVQTLPQAAFWGVFIIISFVIAGKSLSRGETARRRAGRTQASSRGRVATWSVRLERAEKRYFSKWRLAKALKNLSDEILSSGNQPYPDQMQQLGVEHDSDLPPEIEAYFEAQMPRHQGISGFWRRYRAEQRPTVLDLDPEDVVKYLENRLEPLIGE